ncbi:hypothetical protein ACWDNT_21795, partial [Streptomyces sp. NPDC000963]
SALQWAVTAFALPSGGFLLLFGRIGDLYGRKLFRGEAGRSRVGGTHVVAVPPTPHTLNAHLKYLFDTVMP